MHVFSRRSAGYLVVATGLALTLTGPLSAQSQGQGVTGRDQKQLVESLRSGGYVIVVRHGATFSDQADTDPFNFDNSIHYVAPDVRETNFPGASAMLLRGKDTHGYWLPEKRPKADLDPDCLAELDRVFTLYKMAPQRGKKKVDPLLLH
jgi:hypothetical protein